MNAVTGYFLLIVLGLILTGMIIYGVYYIIFQIQLKLIENAKSKILGIVTIMALCMKPEQLLNLRKYLKFDEEYMQNNSYIIKFDENERSEILLDLYSQFCEYLQNYRKKFKRSLMTIKEITYEEFDSIEQVAEILKFEIIS